MFGVAQLRRGAIGLRARVDQLFRVEHVAAVIALIGARAFKAADVTSPFDVAVRQEFVCARGVPLLAEFLEKKSVLLQGKEHRLRDLEVVLAVRRCEHIVGDTVTLEHLNKRIMIFFVDFLDGPALLVRGKHNGRAVRIRPAHHQNVIPYKTMVARNNVTGQMGACDISDMDLGI